MLYYLTLNIFLQIADICVEALKNLFRNDEVGDVSLEVKKNEIIRIIPGNLLRSFPCTLCRHHFLNHALV